MELRQIAQFMAVAEAKSFRRAAERLQMTQPPLSLAVGKLEREMNVRLLDRTSRSVELTEAGKSFLADSKRAIADLDAAVQAAQRVAEGRAGTLSVGLTVPWSYDFAPQVLREFHARYPTVTISLREMPSSEQARRILNRDLDIGFLRLPNRYSAPGMEMVTLRADRFAVVLPKRHALAGRKRLTLGELREESFVLPPFPAEPGVERFSIRIQIVNMCMEAGFAPRISQEAIQMQSIIRLVEAGFGISIVPEWTRTHFRTNVDYRGLVSAATSSRMRLVIAWNADNPSPMLRHFVATARVASPKARSERGD